MKNNPEMDLFLEATSHYRNFNEFSLALETGMGIGEILGLKWSDIDFENQTIYVNRTLVYDITVAIKLISLEGNCSCRRELSDVVAGIQVSATFIIEWSSRMKLHRPCASQAT